MKAFEVCKLVEQPKQTHGKKDGKEQKRSGTETTF